MKKKESCFFKNLMGKCDIMKKETYKYHPQCLGLLGGIIMTEKEHKCEDEDCECNELSCEDLANYADAKADALIELLIKKGIITDKEIKDEFDSMFDESEDKEE